MKTVFVVEVGYYSDVHIEAICSDEVIAQELVKTLPDAYCTEWPINTVCPKVYRFKAYASRDDDFTAVESEGPTTHQRYRDSDVYWWDDGEKYDSRENMVSALGATEEEARKNALDYKWSCLANNQK